ncbi:MAG TPA: hypothetical protein VIR63_05080 [Pontiella sp.]
MEELDPIMLKQELDQFKKEKEKIRQLMGQIGGKDAEKKDRWLNMVFISAVILIAFNDIMHHIFHISTPVSVEFSIGLAVLLISIKIIWMMHKAAKVEHFQFWILNSIEFRLNDVSKQLRHLEKTVNKYHTKETDINIGSTPD